MMVAGWTTVSFTEHVADVEPSDFAQVLTHRVRSDHGAKATVMNYISNVYPIYASLRSAALIANSPLAFLQVVAQFALNAVAGSTAIGDRILTQAYDQKARAHARTVVRLWAAKGYQPVYLSGRQVSHSAVLSLCDGCGMLKISAACSCRSGMQHCKHC